MAVARVAGLLVFAAVSLLSACAAHRPGPYQPQVEADRDPALAQRLTLQAVDLLSRDPSRAESLLRDALTADLFHGPAHNNLGVVLLGKGMLYESAGEFEWARKLMPGHPDPRVNLAMVYERAGKVQEALASYESALEVYPGHIAALEGITLLQVRAGQLDDKTVDRLGEVAMRGESDQWRDWARLELAKRSR